MPQPREFKNQTLEHLKKYCHTKEPIENVMNTMPESEYLDNEERLKILYNRITVLINSSNKETEISFPNSNNALAGKLSITHQTLNTYLNNLKDGRPVTADPFDTKWFLECCAYASEASPLYLLGISEASNAYDYNNPKIKIPIFDTISERTDGSEVITNNIYMQLGYKRAHNIFKRLLKLTERTYQKEHFIKTVSNLLLYQSFDEDACENTVPFDSGKIFIDPDTREYDGKRHYNYYYDKNFIYDNYQTESELMDVMLKCAKNPRLLKIAVCLLENEGYFDDKRRTKNKITFEEDWFGQNDEKSVKF